MRLLITLLLVGACGGDGDTTPPPVSGVTATLRWSYVVSTATCRTTPICTGTCGQTGGCECDICANPPCQPSTQTEHCCSKVVTIRGDAVDRLPFDYPDCDISETSAGVVVDCPFGPVYSGGSVTRGDQYRYTTDMPCKWLPPYRL